MRIRFFPGGRRSLRQLVKLTAASCVLLAAGCGAPAPPDTAVGGASPDSRTGEGTLEVSATQSSPMQPARPVADGPAPAPAIGGEARLGVGDVLEIEVFGLEELDRRVRVQEDGTISMPLLGKIPVQNLTLSAAEERVANLLAERRLVNDPQVSVFVEEFTSRGVSVQGAVNEPGVYQVVGNRSLLELIGEAGGFGPGRGKELYVLRQPAAGGQHRFEVNIDALVEGRDRSLNIFLEPGDLVMVPQARLQRVYVTGAVASPGAIEFSSGDGITVLQAITAAGGPTERANLKKVSVSRRLDDGTQQRWELNVRAIQNGKEDDFSLEGNDTVVVREWLF